MAVVCLVSFVAVLSSRGEAVPARVASRSTVVCATRAVRPTGRSRGTLEVDGVTRHYLLVVPPHSRHPGPLVIALHGWGEDAESFASLTRIERAAEHRGVTVVIPSARHGSWQLDPLREDVAFVDALRTVIPRETCVDEHRIDVLGFSQGAALAIVDACSHPRGIAAIATVAVEFQLGCRRPLSLLAFHGMLDRAVPFANGAIGASLPGIAVTGTWANMARWAALDRCAPRPRRTPLAAHTTKAVWSHCAAGTGLELIVEKDAGHSWPGAAPARSVEPTDDAISATDLSLAFFSTHRGAP